jgi:hypothetical protein
VRKQAGFVAPSALPVVIASGRAYSSATEMLPLFVELRESKWRQISCAAAIELELARAAA